MDAKDLILLAIAAGIFILLAYLVMKLREIERGARAALQNLQIQVAFISGRIGLRNQDLQAATARTIEKDAAPVPAPEVIGGMGWNDIDELLDRAERGEIETEESEHAG